MQACIKVKEVQFRHQIIWTGVRDRAHCHFCCLAWETRAEADEALLAAKQWAETRFPEDAEL
jgi:hypothetical protein